MLASRLDSQKPLIAVSTKAYFSAAKTLEWMKEVANSPVLTNNDAIDLAVIPSFPSLSESATILDGTGILLGAQDVAPSELGAQTGEVRASLLAELGCSLCEVGHAERRAMFGETDEIIARKVRACLQQGMVPLLCAGEAEPSDPVKAGGDCAKSVLLAIKDSDAATIVVAYEPIWAIGATEAADPQYVVDVVTTMSQRLEGEVADLRIIYGGSAGPGLIGHLRPAVDGLFLGRRAHDVAGFERVVEEALGWGPEETPPFTSPITGEHWSDPKSVTVHPNEKEYR